MKKEKRQTSTTRVRKKTGLKELKKHSVHKERRAHEERRDSIKREHKEKRI